jgi:hypothetical protein
MTSDDENKLPTVIIPGSETGRAIGPGWCTDVLAVIKALHAIIPEFEHLMVRGFITASLIAGLYHFFGGPHL